MTILVSHLLAVRKELAIELQRFLLLWRYQHPVTPFALGWRLLVKRLVDLVGGGIGMLVAGPVMALTALAIKLDSKGSILYSQRRVGRFGELFRMYKFRTMAVNAEADGPVWAAGEDDPRLTRLGGFLRRTHLDELPQLLNVLKGEMTLVGPRPERPHFVGEFNREIAGYDERLLVKPGITGLAQVHYRYDQTIADVRRKLRFDLLYVRRLCLTLDVKILAWTFIVVMTGRGIR